MKARLQPKPTGESADPPVCPICHSTATSRHSAGRDRLFGVAKGIFYLHRCLSCRCVFQNPLPTPSNLAEFYPQEYWWAEDSESNSLSTRLFSRMEKTYRELVTEDHVRFLRSCARNSPNPERTLLDIGCGSGTFLQVARSHGFVPHGMDSSKRAVDIARSQYGLEVRQGEVGSQVWEERRFDFVTMFHVLEHLPDPRLGLRYAAGLLKPGGTLIIQVPNLASIQARFFGSLWYGLDVPRHVTNFTPKALDRLLRETGNDFFVVSRFSLRDNPASIASSLFPGLDPVRRKVRRSGSSPAANGALELAYFGLFLISVPFALLESALGLGGTLWACVRRNSKTQGLKASKG